MDTPPAIDDATAEALLSGRAVAGEYEPLRQLLAACRDTAGRPVPPRGDLAALLASGGFMDPADRPAGARTNRRGPRASAARRWRRIRMAIVSGLATAAAKIAGAGVAVKASAGVAVALAGVGTAGAAGALPEPVQDRFDTVVESVSDPGGPTPPPSSGPAEDAEFGQQVSEDARDGGVDGAEISEDARQQGGHGPDRLPTPAAGPPADAGQPTGPPVPTAGAGTDPGAPGATPTTPHRPDPASPAHP